MEKAKGNFQNMGGARGVGNPVCPRAAPARTVGKCWVVHAFKRRGRESPREPVRARFFFDQIVLFDLKKARHFGSMKSTTYARGGVIAGDPLGGHSW